jgi:hypothetical protein
LFRHWNAAGVCRIFEFAGRSVKTEKTNDQDLGLKPEDIFYWGLFSPGLKPGATEERERV